MRACQADVAQTGPKMAPERRHIACLAASIQRCSGTELWSQLVASFRPPSHSSVILIFSRCV